MDYRLIRKLLFCLEAEQAHHFSLSAMKLSHGLGLSGLYRSLPSTSAQAGATEQQSFQCLGLNFANRLGLAAGLDKNADYIDALGDLGFGFIEVGTVTPRPQPGNPRPRLFRLPEHEAIINRMGFNNKGVDHLVAQVQKRKYAGILGINIGKNFDTPVENAVSDYLAGLKKVYAHADYVTINLSSPNTPGLRKLQMGDALKKLVNQLADCRDQLAAQHRKQVPLLIKIAPDMETDEIVHLADTALACRIDGLIATNTTISRSGVESSAVASEAGGLSGKPLFQQSTEVLKTLANYLQGRMVLVGVGGIDSAESAREKLQAGADLLQVYTGFIYKGPQLVSDVCGALNRVRPY